MQLESKKHTLSITYSQILLGMLLCCGLLTGILPRSLVDLAVVVICCGLLLTGDLILAYPFMLFYYGTFGLVMGVSTYRIFSLLLLFDVAWKLKSKVNIRLSVLPPVIVYGLYLLLVLSSYSFQRSLFCMIDILCVLAVLGYLDGGSDNIRAFFRQYVIVTIVAIICGAMMGNTLIEGNEWEGEHITRFMATFEDPNYMGFFLSISVFATVILKLFKPLIRWIVIIAIYAAILASASMTAIVVHIVLWLLYLVVAKKINFKVAIACFVIIALALGVYQYGLEHPDAPVVGSTAYRIQKKLIAWEEGDMTAVTTNRSNLSREHWEYFLKQSLGRMFIGGTMVNAIHLSPEFKMAAHNEYVDMLLNIGILGAAVMLWYMASNTVKRLLAYKKTQDDTHLLLFMVKCVWIAYGMALTMFLEFRFMLPFFI